VETFKALRNREQRTYNEYRTQMTEKRRMARERVFALLEQTAKAETLDEVEAEAQQPAPCRREARRPTAVTDPPPPDKWE
jgi:hypothetical protein